MQGKYLYGIIMGSGDTVLGVKGMVGSSIVSTIAHEGLSCVVSDYTGGSFKLMSKEELAQRMVTHQVVVEQVMKKHPILPLKFGTVLATADEVHDLLAQGHPQFFLTLLWIQDKAEIEVVSTWTGGRVLEENGAGLEMLPAGDSLPQQPVEAPAEQRPQSYLERMIGFLQPISVDLQAHPPGWGEKAASVAFLVAQANLDAFQGRIKQLNALFFNQIDFQVIGPLPPYSFATVEAFKPDPEAIEEARRMLNLSEVDCEVEVRKAYRRLASESHPGQKPGENLARTRLAALRRASDLLVAYCRRQAEDGGSFLISVRRSRVDEIRPPRLVEIGI